MRKFSGTATLERELDIAGQIIEVSIALVYMGVHEPAITDGNPDNRTPNNSDLDFRVTSISMGDDDTELDELWWPLVLQYFDDDDFEEAIRHGK